MKKHAYFSKAKLIVLSLCMSLLSSSASYAEDGLSSAISAGIQNSLCQQIEISETKHSELTEFYAARNFAPVWFEEGKVNPQAKLLLSELLRSRAHGLKPEFYNHSMLMELAEKQDAEDQACFEISLSKALVLYANDLANGHVTLENSPENTIVQRIDYRPKALLEKANELPALRALLQSLLTTDDRYIRLITKLAEFLRIEKANAWPNIGNTETSDNSDVDYDKVRELLLYTGDLSSENLSKAETGSKLLEDAIASFQERHGLDKTGTVDTATLVEMAMPLSDRIDMIRVNLERRRWQNRDLGSDYAYINMNDNSVRFVRDDKKSGSGRIRESKNTDSLPAFYGEVTAVKSNEAKELVLEISSNSKALSVEFVLEGNIRDNLKHLTDNFAETEESINSGDRVVLSEPFEVFVTYLTVWANKDGSIHFRPDRFKRDAKIAKLLQISSD